MSSTMIGRLSMPDRIDDNNLIAIKALLEDLMKNGAKKILCDFSRTVFISEASALFFFQAAQSLRQNGGELAICQIPPAGKAVFDALGFSPFFRFYNLEESVAIITLRQLVHHFDLYEDLLDLHVRKEQATIIIEIHLAFDGKHTMSQVQKSIDAITCAVKQEVKNANVIIVASAAAEQGSPNDLASIHLLSSRHLISSYYNPLT